MKGVDLKTLNDTPSWDWPRDADQMLLAILLDDQSDEFDRLLAAGLCGDFTVINEELADALLKIVRNADEPHELRAQAKAV